MTSVSVLTADTLRYVLLIFALKWLCNWCPMYFEASINQHKKYNNSTSIMAWCQHRGSETCLARTKRNPMGHRNNVNSI